MKKSPLISVIVPVYNVEKYIDQCLGSLVFQTYKNLEIIIVDDGSPDNSAAIYGRYAKSDKRIKIIKQKNMGLSAARNSGLDSAKGEYVHFMDSDDYIPIDYYEKMIAGAVSVDADMSAGGIVSSDGTRRQIFDTPLLLIDLEQKVSLFRPARFGYVVRYLFKRKFLIDNKLRFVAGRYIEDVPFTLAALKASNRVAIVPGANYCYIIRRGSTMTSKNRAMRKKRLADYRWARAQVNNFFAENNLSRNLIDAPKTVQKIRLFGIIPFAKIITMDQVRRSELKVFGIPLFKTKKEIKNG